jgi:hypothetical protein
MVRLPEFTPILGAIAHTPELLATVKRTGSCPVCRGRIGAAKGQEEVPLVCVACDSVAPAYRTMAKRHDLGATRHNRMKPQPKPKPAPKRKDPVTLTVVERAELRKEQLALGVPPEVIDRFFAGIDAEKLASVA